MGKICKRNEKANNSIQMATHKTKNNNMINSYCFISEQMMACMDTEKLNNVMHFMLIHEIFLSAVRTFFTRCVLDTPDYNKSIISFLNHHKHELFHLTGRTTCCHCDRLPILHPTLYTVRLENDQFEKLYDVGVPNPEHYTNASPLQQCLCCITVKHDTNPKTYDMPVLLTLLYNCVQLSDNMRLWLDTISQYRNRIVKCILTKQHSNNELQISFGKLERSVLSLAVEVYEQHDYKRSILHDIFKYAEYSRDPMAHIKSAMEPEVNNVGKYKASHRKYILPYV